jgi:hypothetical protein
VVRTLADVYRWALIGEDVPENRVLTIDVGSLIRPPELLAQMEARQDGWSIDDGISPTRSATRWRGRPSAGDTGIGIVSDSEFGKPAAIRRPNQPRVGMLRPWLIPIVSRSHALDIKTGCRPG